MQVPTDRRPHRQTALIPKLPNASSWFPQFVLQCGYYAALLRRF